MSRTLPQWIAWPALWPPRIPDCGTCTAADAIRAIVAGLVLGIAIVAVAYLAARRES